MHRYIKTGVWIYLLTYTCCLHVALVGHAVPPQALVGIAAWEAILHPIVCRCGDHYKDVPNNGAEQAAAHKAVHPDTRCDYAGRRYTLKRQERHFNFTHTDAYVHILINATKRLLIINQKYKSNINLIFFSSNQHLAKMSTHISTQIL